MCDAADVMMPAEQPQQPLEQAGPVKKRRAKPKKTAVSAAVSADAAAVPAEEEPTLCEDEKKDEKKEEPPKHEEAVSVSVVPSGKAITKKKRVESKPRMKTGYNIYLQETKGQKGEKRKWSELSEEEKLPYHQKAEELNPVRVPKEKREKTGWILFLDKMEGPLNATLRSTGPKIARIELAQLCSGPWHQLTEEERALFKEKEADLTPAIGKATAFAAASAGAGVGTTPVATSEA